MEMTISVITPTADRPVAFALLERYLTRQTIRYHEWIVADGGQEPVECTAGRQIHIHQPAPAGMANFGRNLLNAAKAATGDLIVVAEDDDWYAPAHLERLVAAFAHPHPLIAGDDQQRYYNVQHRCWRLFQNVGASLCQTAFRRELLPLFTDVVRNCLQRQAIGVDAALWAAVPERRSLKCTNTVVGTKGLPGRPGLGIGHRPDHHWTADPDLRQLTAWIGAEDVATYAPMARRAA